jgi:hypothetical protein
MLGSVQILFDTLLVVRVQAAGHVSLILKIKHASEKSSRGVQNSLTQLEASALEAEQMDATDHQITPQVLGHIGE